MEYEHFSTKIDINYLNGTHMHERFIQLLDRIKVYSYHLRAPFKPIMPAFCGQRINNYY